jgi:hypothetical protein
MHIFIYIVGNPARSTSCALIELLALAEAPLADVSQTNHLHTISWNVLHHFSNLQSISFRSFSLYYAIFSTLICNHSLNLEAAALCLLAVSWQARLETITVFRSQISSYFPSRASDNVIEVNIQ